HRRAVPHGTRASEGAEVAELASLGLEILGVFARLRRHQRHALLNPQAVPFEADELLRIVCHRPERLHAEVEEDLRTDAVVPEVGRKPQSLVRLDGVRTAVLQLVRLELVQEADAAAFLIEVDDYPPSLPRDQLHRRVELPAAVAARGVEDVAGET